MTASDMESLWRGAIGYVRSYYPESTFPKDGNSLDCLSANLVRKTLDNVIREFKRRKALAREEERR